MKFSFDGWRVLALTPLLGAFACSGEHLYDVGNLTSSNGGDPGEEQPSYGGSAVPPQQQGNGGARMVVVGDAGAPVGGESPVPPEGGSPNVGGEGGEGGAGGAAPVGPCAPGTNLLQNGSFSELSNDFPTAWTRNGNPKGFVTFDATNGSDGGASIKLSMLESYEYWVEQRVSSPCIVPGELLRFSGYYLSSVANPDIEPGIFIGDPEIPLPVPTTANEWLPFSVDVVAPAKAFRVVVWSIGSYSKVPTTLWYDDVSLVRVPTP